MIVRAIDSEKMRRIVAYVQQYGPSPNSVQELRTLVEGVHFSWCLDEDVQSIVSPAAAGENFNIYLVDSSQHCALLTQDMASASGVVVAEVNC